MQSVKFLREVAHRNVVTEWVTCQILWGARDNYQQRPTKLEALHLSLTCHYSENSAGWDHPFYPLEDFIEKYWHPPKVFILRAISIEYPAYLTGLSLEHEHQQYSLRIGEKNYHAWRGSEINLCEKGEEYERGLSLYAPQNFWVTRVQPPGNEPVPFKAKFHGIFLREIC